RSGEIRQISGMVPLRVRNDAMGPTLATVAGYASEPLGIRSIAQNSTQRSHSLYATLRTRSRNIATPSTLVTPDFTLLSSSGTRTLRIQLLNFPTILGSLAESWRERPIPRWQAPSTGYSVNSRNWPPLRIPNWKVPRRSSQF